MRVLGSLTVAVVVGASALTGPARAEPVAVEPLTGVHNDGGRLVDDQGRTVILRGINAVDKTGWQGSLAAPIVTDDDLARLSDIGFNHLRLGLTWDSVEHERDTFDDAYVDQLLEVLDRVHAHGMLAVIDVHQDVWSHHIGGFDGAPAWADPQCRQPPRVPLSETTGVWFAQYGSPDVQAAWSNFWADGHGDVDLHCTGPVQTEFVDMWRHLAGRLNGHPAVVGYDLLNEPWPGAPPGAFETTMLTPFYDRLAAAIRAVDPHTPIFFEPPIWKSAALPTVGLESPDDNAVFAPHIYTETMFSEGQVSTGALTDEVVLLTDLEEAHRMGVPVWIGEWGAFENDATEPYLRQMYDLFDRYQVGSAYWRYAQYPGEQVVTGERESGHVRVYPEAYPGSASWSFAPDSTSFVMSVTVDQPGEHEVRIVVPERLDIDTSTAPGTAYDPASQRLLWTVTGPGTATLQLSP